MKSNFNSPNFFKLIATGIVSISLISFLSGCACDRSFAPGFLSSGPIPPLPADDTSKVISAGISQIRVYNICSSEDHDTSWYDLNTNTRIFYSSNYVYKIFNFRYSLFGYLGSYKSDRLSHSVYFGAGGMINCNITFKFRRLRVGGGYGYAVAYEGGPYEQYVTNMSMKETASSSFHKFSEQGGLLTSLMVDSYFQYDLSSDKKLVFAFGSSPGRNYWDLILNDPFLWTISVTGEKYGWWFTLPFIKGLNGIIISGGVTIRV